LLTIIKNGDASTLDVVNRVKAALPEIEKAAPPGMDIKLMFDQSVFVQNAIDSVLHEGVIAAGLTALMILIFLGSWRSTLVVMVSIPLSILTSIAVLTALGQTINTMTLGGMALAVGILVDDSTVTIENTHRLLEERMPFDRAVLEGAAGIAVPTLIPRLPSAAYSSLCSSCKAPRAICSRRLRWRWCSPCLRPTPFRGP
jgi:multidrug efflux pump subunit AcrB